MSAATSWRKNAMIVLGIILLAVPAVVLLHYSDKVFRDECRAKCDAFAMDYKVRAVRRDDPMEYPAECICVARSVRPWWRFWD